MAPQKTRERALTEREFERLLIGAGRIDDAKKQIEARAVVLIGGRLGLRPGEATHLDASWVDRRREIIRIPDSAPCEKGRGGGPCGYCKQAARQVVAHDSEKAVGDVLDEYWQPKTDAAARDVPYGFSTRLSVAIELLIDECGGWPYSFSTLQRRVEQALNHAPGLSHEATTPHGLRGTAATYHAARGLEPAALQAMLGWEDLATATHYVAVDGEMTRRALLEVHR